MIAEPENEATVGWMTLGLQVMVTVAPPDLAVSPVTHPFVAKFVVPVIVPPVTSDTSEPLVVQSLARTEMVRVSGLVPPFSSGGLNVAVPDSLQLMVPVATTGIVVDAAIVVVDALVVVDDLELLEQPARTAAETSKSAKARPL
jgi:hypothetical protein